MYPLCMKKSDAHVQARIQIYVQACTHTLTQYAQRQCKHSIITLSAAVPSVPECVITTDL